MAIPASARNRQWPPMDPGDLIDVAADFSDLLQVAEGEGLDPEHLTILPSAEAVLAGLQIGTGDRAPAIDENLKGDPDTNVKLWLSVDEGEQDNPRFDAGAVLDVKMVVRTTAERYRIFERTFLAMVINL